MLTNTPSTLAARLMLSRSHASSKSFFEGRLLDHLRLCLAFELSEEKDKQEEDRPPQVEEDHKPEDETEDERDEIIKESFPASDPPPPPTTL